MPICGMGISYALREPGFTRWAGVSVCRMARRHRRCLTTFLIGRVLLKLLYLKWEEEGQGDTQHGSQWETQRRDRSGRRGLMYAARVG